MAWFQSLYIMHSCGEAIITLSASQSLSSVPNELVLLKERSAFSAAWCAV